MSKCNVIILMLIIGSCVGCVKKEKESNAKQLTIDWSSISDEMDYSSMVEDSVLLIPLETTEGCLIGEVTQLIYRNGLIYIADNMSKSIFVFDLSGKFRTKIHATGNGPGEYTHISSFTVHGFDMVIFDHYIRKLLFYDRSGQFIREKRIDGMWCEDLFSMNDKLYLANRSKTKSGCNHVYTLDLNNSDKIEKYFPFEEQKDNQGWGIHSYYAQLDNHEALLCFWPYDKLYTIKEGEAYLSYEIDFGNKRLPTEYIEGDGTTALKTAIRDSYVTGLDRVRQSNKYVFLQFGDSNNDYVAIYNKETDEMQTTKCLKNSKLGGLALALEVDGEKFTIQNEKIIQCYDAGSWGVFNTAEDLKSSGAHFYSEELRQQFLKLAQTDETESNPIILIQNLKK